MTRHLSLTRIYALLTLCLLALAPYSASAVSISAIERFDNVSASTTRYTEGTAMYTVNFRLHAFGEDVALPMGVVRGESSDSTVYVIENRSKEVTKSGHSVALLLSQDAAVQDGRYIIPKDSARNFTLIAAWSDSPNQVDPEGRLRVTHMPMTLGTDMDIVLNRHELQGLLTEYVSLDGND